MPQCLHELPSAHADRISSAEVIIVAGNSGSLLETPPQSEWRPHYLIGVNRILRTGLDGRVYTPDLATFNDSRVLTTDRPQYARRSQRTALATGALTAKWMQHFLLASPDYTYWIKEETHRDRGFPMTLAGDPVCVHNVTFVACQIAMCLAVQFAKPVVLIGCEMGYPSTSHAFPTHFYNVEEVNRMFPVATDRPRQTGPRIGSWSRLAAAVVSRGVDLYDASPWRARGVTPASPFPSQDAVVALAGLSSRKGLPAHATDHRNLEGLATA